jgi:hypothetical protein
MPDFSAILNGAVPVEFDPGPVNATAYAAKHADERELIAVINKDAARELRLDPALRGWRVTVRLSWPALAANEARLGPVKAGKHDLRVPAASAAILTWGGRRDQFGSR